MNVFSAESFAEVANAVSGNVANERVEWTAWPVLAHSVRTAVAAVAALLVAQLFWLPEAYWALMIALVIMQSSLGATLAVSRQRFIGVALGAVMGAFVASYFGRYAFVFGACVFMLGLLRTMMRSELTAYRYGRTTLAIVLLVPRTGPPWQLAFYQFAELSIGIGVTLILALMWPEREDTPSRKAEFLLRCGTGLIGSPEGA